MPMLISPEYAALNAELHQRIASYERIESTDDEFNAVLLK